MINKVDLDKLLKSKKISQRTYDKVTIAKQIIERKYNLKNIKNLEINTIFSKIDSLDISQSQKEQIKQEIYTQESSKFRRLREKQTIRDYTSIAIIGRGAFGEVHVCREKKTGQIVAVKKIRKDVLMMKNQVIHVRNEQLFMSKVRSEWIVELKASFQEDDYLYLVMEFLPGGDFMNLLIKKDILTEEEARFYTAELILAIENIHKLDCIHRDIKPDNILIDKSGHIKLSDFGLAKVSNKMLDMNNNDINEEYEENSHQKNYSCVGTAYYVAPEVLNKKGYGPEIDWWSVGVIFFEMLIGYAPFCSKHTHEVCQKVLNWKKFLKIPKKKKISKEAEDLIFKLINNPKERLGIGGSEEIKAHPFFKGVDWNNIRNTKAPFIPKLKNDYDTAYFDTIPAKEPFYPQNNNKKLKRKDIEFLGYTYKEGDFDDFYNLENKVMESIENIKYINEDKSNGESFENLSNNSNSNSDNREKNKSNGIDKKVSNNNISINIEKKYSPDNTDENKILKTKKINKSKDKIINKINIINDNNYIVYDINTIFDKSSINNNKNNTLIHTINYNKPVKNDNLNQNLISKKFTKNIQINKISNNPTYYSGRNDINNKNLKTEPNNSSNDKNIIYNYLEYPSTHNNTSKLNVIQLPTKKAKEKTNKKIIIPENGASSNDKNIVIKNIKKNNNYHRYSPQPKDVLFQKYLITKNNLKNKNWINFNTLESAEKGVIKKSLTKVINQNTFKKKIVNSAKSIFIQKKNTQNNFLNNYIKNVNQSYNNNSMTERKNKLNNSNDKVTYIYKKKL